MKHIEVYHGSTEIVEHPLKQFMSTAKDPDMQYLPQDVENILQSGRIGIIANAIATKLDIDGVRALEMFYDSETCKHLHNKSTGMYLYSELYIADEFLRELQGKQ